MSFPKQHAFKVEEQLLSGRSQALAHPARLVILQLLRIRPMHVRDLTLSLPLVQATVSGHLEILRRWGFLTVEVQGRYNLYTLDLEAIEEYEHDMKDFLNGVIGGDVGEGGSMERDQVA